MNRLHQKSAVASAGFHLLLVVLVLSASAFRSATTQRGNASAEPAPIQLMPGPPEESPTAAAASPAATVAPPVLPSQPRTPSEPLSTSSPGLEPRPKLPRVSLVPVTRETGRPVASNSSRVTSSRVAALDGVLKNLGRNLAPPSTVDSGSGVGGDDDSSDYAQRVKAVYAQHWDPSGIDVSKDGAVTTVSVTIASDGKVVSAQIVQPSDDTQATESVRRTLSAIAFIAPFESGAKAKQRTYTIHFNVRTRHLLAE